MSEKLILCRSTSTSTSSTALQVFNGNFQDNVGKPVPECQIILGFTAARDDGGDSGDIRIIKRAKLQ